MLKEIGLWYTKRVGEYMKAVKFKIYGLIIGIILCISMMSFILLSTPILKLNGKNNITIDVFSEYKEEGASARTLLQNMNHKIKIDGEVNTSQVGTYKITYSIQINRMSASLVRFVNIVDREAPEIVLKGEQKVFVCPKKEYEEEGYEAFDNYDGDLTDHVKITQEENKFIYQVKDMSKNETKIEREIVKEDVTAPTIILKGNENVTVYLGSTYEDPGVEVQDNCDEYIEVITEGNVENKLGTYIITYIAKDESGNEASIKRTVTVKEKPIVIIPDNSTIYFTFDDGPSSITPKVLDILKKYHIKATFFVINHSSSYDGYIKRAYQEGHTVAVHSYTHNYGQIYASEDAYLNDFNLMRNKIYHITGEYPNLFRFPGGSSNTVSKFNPKIMTKLTNLMEDKGYAYFDWNVSSGDAGGTKNSNDVYKNVVNNVGKFHSYIVLMHDFEGNYKTLNALEDIIINLKNRGYKFDRLTKNSYKAHHGIAN